MQKFSFLIIELVATLKNQAISHENPDLALLENRQSGCSRLASSAGMAGGRCQATSCPVGGTETLWVTHTSPVFRSLTRQGVWVFGPGWGRSLGVICLQKLSARWWQGGGAVPEGDEDVE